MTHRALLTVAALFVLGACTAYWYRYHGPMAAAYNATFLQEWRVRAYGRVETELTGDVLSLQTARAPAGLVLRMPALSPEGIYLLKLSGQTVQGTASLRLRHDRAEPSYLRAPDGDWKLIVQQTSDLELMLYADDNFRYDLRHVSVTPCNDCPTDDRLRQRILQEVPNLHRLLSSDPERALLGILGWVSNELDSGTQATLIKRNTDNALMFSAAQIHQEILETDDGGFWCAGNAIFFRKVLELFGYTSFTLNFGTNADSLNHVTTIVAQESASGYRFWNMDPTFNVTFWDADGNQMLDFVGLVLQHINEPISNGIERQGNIERRDYLVETGRLNSQRCPDPVEDRGDHWLCRNQDHTLAYQFSSPHSWGNLLERNGYNRGTAGYFDLVLAGVFDVGPSNDEKARQAFLAALQNLGVPFHEA